MKVLYAIQGTGNGHLCRAKELIPHLIDYVDLDIAVSGTESEVTLPIELRFKLNGLSFTFGKSGGIDYAQTLKKFNPMLLQQEIKQFPAEKYDLIINDFEPVTAWAARSKNVPVIAVSHQASFLSEHTPRPSIKSPLVEFLFKWFAPCTKQIGFHYTKYDSFIETPLVRKDIRRLQSSNKGHYTMYLPAIKDDTIIDVFTKLPDCHFEVFSKRATSKQTIKNVEIHPISNQEFLESFATCDTFITAAGFQSTSEALFLGKKLIVIPMKGQYEQTCNAVALKSMGIPLLKDLSLRSIDRLKDAIKNTKVLKVDYPDNVALIVKKILSNDSMNIENTELIEPIPLNQLN
ncbi:MAG: glycosyl transferase [Deltaproteobacteria bacterium]|nr:glycosyl transferase [Deltaproteobacteria bacterium]